ncbi:hypothetical protein B0T16DRAFT_328701 [Cercophora newfieldiana]|uniref:Septin-type G domain-containing protein n=1 Tax=Cercophora newfieldiana TaxID=92897 RepID=A0AA40CRB5_9PEZI|nr:hypothetical protein B0T16DRAFT_328701 [Cercophora newfieldiana]
MRPSAGDDAFGRHRVAADNETLGLPQAPQMTYFFADESAVGSSSPTSFHRSKDKDGSSGSGSGSGGGQKINPAAASDSTTPKSLSQQLNIEQQPRDSRGSNVAGDSPSRSRNAAAAATAASLRHDDEDTLSNPVTPPLRPSTLPSLGLSPGASGPASAMSSVSSRRGSFTGSLSEDLLSTHTASVFGGAGTGGSEDVDREMPSVMMDSGSAPQLIMPSIKMPSRRPFTDEGKSMGRLKVLVAGDSGVGKTSLIKAIVQSCDHIVHVDPITPSVSSSAVLRPGTRLRGGSGGSRRHSKGGTESGTTQITEIYASTKPYPEWWSEMDDFRLLRRRKRLGDSVLDRNICFVDTPGYGSGSSSMDTITPVTDYIEGHFRRMSAGSLSDGDTLNMVGGEGGVQVDVVFYMVSNRLRPIDIQYLRQVAPLTNVMLLLAQSDLMSPEQIKASKEQINSQLKEAKIWPFSFAATSGSPSPFDPATQGLYAISSATGSDHDTMDASLLMSPDYVQPLISTDLATLVHRVFSQDGASWLRHFAARKYVQWRNSKANIKPFSLQQPLSLSGSPSQPHQSRSNNNSQILTPAMGPTSSYALARITDHTQREERLAQVRFANWAADLQKSLANERAQYAALARGERAVWLTEKINECVQDGSLVPLPGRGRSRSTERIREQIRRKLRVDPTAVAAGFGNPGGQVEMHQDPLGLLQVASELRYKGLVALEVLGSLGLVSGLIVWAFKYPWHLQIYDWAAGSWDKVMGGGR